MIRAQYDPSFSHYFDMEPTFNPAAVGKQSKLNVSAAYALDMAGFEHNPRTMHVAADMPFYALKNYHGVGLSLMNDQIGLFTHQRLALQYALKRPLFHGTLSIGLQGAMISEKFDGSKVDCHFLLPEPSNGWALWWELGRQPAPRPQDQGQTQDPCKFPNRHQGQSQ